MELIQLKQKEIKKYRDKILAEQDGICPLTGIKIEEGKATLDHQHATKSEVLGEKGAGCVRGVLDFRANAAEGKILYWFKRMGLSPLIALPIFLRNLADYLEKETTNLIHPSEIKPKKLSKVCYNKLMKVLTEKEKVPYKAKLTKKLEKLFKKYKIEVEYK